MAPEPIGGLLVYHLFQQTGEQRGLREIFCFFSEGMHTGESTYISSPAGSADMGEKECGIHLSSDLFRACEYGRVGMVQEWQEEVHAAPVGQLVGDESDDSLLSFLFQLYDAAQRQFHGDALAAEAVSQPQEQTVEHRAPERVIYLCAQKVLRQGVGKRGYPFPVSVVPQVNETEVLVFLFKRFCEQLCTVEFHAFAKCPSGHGEQFDGFHDIVAEKTVEFSLDDSEFLVCLVGKRFFQVRAYDVSPVVDDVVDDRIEEVGNPV